MNILFFHRWTGVRGGGTESHLKGLVKHLLPNHEISLLTREGSQINVLKERFPTLNIITIPKAPFENDNSYENPLLLYAFTITFMAFSLLRLSYLLISKKIKPDVISVHFATESVVARVARFLFKIPYVFILEGYTDWEAQEAKKADKALSISHYISQRCNNKYNYYPHVMYIGEDNFPVIENSKLEEKLKRNSKTVLTLCRLEPRKNLFTTLKSISLIKNDFKRNDITFLLGGTGILREEVKKKIGELNLNDYVHLLDFVPQSELADVYQGADIYLLPSYEEGFGIVFAEAMKSGCAIVSTNKTAIPEILDDAGVLIEDPNNEKEIAEAILKLIDDKDLRERKVKRGLEVVKKYDWKDLTKQYENAYKEAANI